MKATYVELRKSAGWSRERAAVTAGVAVATCRAFELGGPDAISDATKRASLVRVYSEFAKQRA